MFLLYDAPPRSAGPRANVFFFALPEAARAAGFRPCLCCRPDETNLRDPQAELVQSVCLLIVGAQVRLSQSRLQRLFKKLMGITPREYADVLRTDRFKERVKAGQSVASVMYEAGYGSSSRLCEKASARLGMTPRLIGRAGRG